MNIGGANHVPVKYKASSDIIIKIFHWNIKIWLYPELRSFYIDSLMTPSHLYGTVTDRLERAHINQILINIVSLMLMLGS